MQSSFSAIAAQQQRLWRAWQISPFWLPGKVVFISKKTLFANFLADKKSPCENCDFRSQCFTW